MPALTRDEAQTRARLLEVHRYSIDLDLTRGDETFASTTVIRFTARETGSTFLDLRPTTLHRILLDGSELDPAALTEGRYPLDGLTPGEHELRVETDMPYSRTGEGMHRFTDPADDETYLYTQGFLDDCQRVFAAFDQPDLKAVFELTVTAPHDWTVLGNGIATRTTGTGTWTIAPTPPISTYLVAVAAGPYHSVRAEHAGLPLGLHARRSLAEHLDADAAELLDITRRCFDRYHEIFDEPYPFDSYDQAFVPEFNAGAMENPGLVTFRDEFVYRSAVTDTERQTRAVVIAHEMAHMWFGDLVTLQWWDDIWLNESFAEYMGYQVVTDATPHQGAWTEFAIARKSWGYDADQRPSTHPVAPDAEAVPDSAAALLNFDGISYAKGASALRQLVAWLGEKDFLAGINDHFARHRFGNATLADFLDSLGRASDQDIHAWADRWLRTTGVDTLTPAVTTRTTDDNPTRHTWNLGVSHSGNRPHHIAVTAYDLAPAAPDALTLRERFDLAIPADGDPRPHALTGPRPDLVLLNDQDLTYAKIRLDPASWTTVRQALSAIPDPLTRSVVWNAARDMVRDGELPPAAYLDAARTHLPQESDVAVAHGVLTFARTQIADRYLAPDARPHALDTLTAVCRDILETTRERQAPGLRLTAVRALIDSAADPAELRDWLTHDTVPHGPRLDPELRWRTLHRLSVLGAATPADIDAELTRDPSATGREGAARCRAALPDPRAKAEAWNALFETDELSNYLFTATAQGFWQPEQHELLEDYLPRYHPAAVAVARRRGSAIAEAAGRWAYPAHAVHPDTRRRTEQCIGDADPVPALRRRLVDHLADLDRALHVRGM
ncbi:aminopeptidase N [Streptomyces meridianus]|uniref:Aminopeptidase N n=1 Tax=Streptomyces meridianus TaxID=2938945 RepID=A0ABT0X1U4_9ACTN|nr:aminopeptidase N [Streptomyces meridianus]MCM2576516.1 aminopeptidase N [Streptomyces meridianus]